MINMPKTVSELSTRTDRKRVWGEASSRNMQALWYSPGVTWEFAPCSFVP